MSRHWLLMLGSNLQSDARVHDAVDHLARLGEIRLLTGIRLTASRRGDGHYYNAIAWLASGLDAADLRSELKAIESELGRERGGSDVVAIDIDILACDAGQGWKRDARALEKGEFDKSPTPELLREAGVVLASD